MFLLNMFVSSASAYLGRQWGRTFSILTSHVVNFMEWLYIILEQPSRPHWQQRTREGFWGYVQCNSFLPLSAACMHLVSSAFLTPHRNITDHTYIHELHTSFVSCMHYLCRTWNKHIRLAIWHLISPTYMFYARKLNYNWRKPVVPDIGLHSLYGWPLPPIHIQKAFYGCFDVQTYLSCGFVLGLLLGLGLS